MLREFWIVSVTAFAVKYKAEKFESKLSLPTRLVWTQTTTVLAENPLVVTVEVLALWGQKSAISLYKSDNPIQSWAMRLWLASMILAVWSKMYADTFWYHMSLTLDVPWES